MLSLGLGLGIGIGFGSRVAAAAATPPNIVTSVAVSHWLRADLGASITSGKLVTLNDQVGTLNVTQVTSSNQPTYNAADSTFSSLATFTTDGVSQFMTAANADLTGSKTIFSVVKIVAAPAFVGMIYGNSKGAQGGDGDTLSTYSGDATLYQAGNGANANHPAYSSAIGNWALIIDRRLGNTSDYLRLGAVQATGTICNLTNSSPGVNWSIGGDGNRASYFGNNAYREIVICDGEPTTSEINALRAYFVAQLSSLLV